VEIDNQRYTGHHPYKIDPKFRVSIQASWRPEAGEKFYLLIAKDLGFPLVRVLTKEAYQYKVDTINQSEKTPAEKGKLLAKLALVSRQGTVNEQGKLLVPKDLSEQAGIAPDSEVMMAGRGMAFEIWSRPTFDEYFAQLTADDAEDDLGIF
jgi:DNA-binding transcriptional regulator/RsmH inhibitor MraZ